jgi:hypothetical protein
MEAKTGSVCCCHWKSLTDQQIVAVIHQRGKKLCAKDVTIKTAPMIRGGFYFIYPIEVFCFLNFNFWQWHWLNTALGVLTTK